MSSECGGSWLFRMIEAGTIAPYNNMEATLSHLSQPQKQRETRGMRRHKAAELTMHQSEAVSDVQVLCLDAD
jgi:hypothetical protein